MGNNSVFVLLAGGKSSRMGVAKGLLKFRHTFWVLEQLERISASHCTEVVLGLGHDYEHYFMAIPWLEGAQEKPFTFLTLQVRVVVNDTPELGQFSTLQKCLNEITDLDSVLISIIDTPIDKGIFLNKLITIDADVAQLNFQGKNGHPIKISSEVHRQLIKIDRHDEEARLDIQLKKTTPARCSLIETPNRDCVINFNTPSQWKEYLAYYKLSLQ